MRRLWVDSIDGETVTLAGEQHHRAVHVLRLGRGDRLRVFDGRGQEREAVIEAVGREQTTLHVERAVEAIPEPAIRLILFQSVPRGDAMERVIQKAVEIGIAEIVPVISRRTVARPDAKRAPDNSVPGETAKLARWRKIALHAVEQSGRAWLVPVADPLPLDSVIARLASVDAALAPHYGAASPIRVFLDASQRPRSAAILVGPEGGFAPEEIERLAAAGVEPVSLGSRILRSETAGLVAAALVLYHFGEMG